jgi:hypothetical protein
MDGVIGTVLSILVLIALLVISIVAFVYINRLNYAMKELQQKMEVMDARSYDNDVLLDSDVRALKTGLVAANSNMSVLDKNILVSSSNASATSSNNFNTLTKRDSVIAVTLSNMGSNIVTPSDLSTKGVPMVRTQSMVLGTNYTLSNINNNLAFRNQGGLDIMALNNDSRTVIFGSNVVVPGKSDFQQICSYNVCANSNVWGRMVLANST